MYLNIDVSMCGMTYVISEKYIYVSVFNNYAFKHGTIEIYPLPLYFLNIFNYPSFNSISHC